MRTLKVINSLRNFPSFQVLEMRLHHSSGHKHHIQRFSSQINSQTSLKFLNGTIDRFNGVSVDLAELPAGTTDADFEKMLSVSLASWISTGKTAVWMRVPILSSHYIPIAAREGFKFHHSDPSLSILTRWLNPATENRLPKAATHQVGCSGFVLREDTREVLVVKDKNKRPALWKFPGGVSDLGENIGDTAEREVFEETGIKSEFQSILGFRQQHLLPGAFGRSDIYFVCRLRPLTFDLNPCEAEISECRWMPLDELAAETGISGITNRITKLIVFGMTEGFDKVDLERDELQSIYKGMKYQIYHRHLPSQSR